MSLELVVKIEATDLVNALRDLVAMMSKTPLIGVGQLVPQGDASMTGSVTFPALVQPAPTAPVGPAVPLVPPPPPQLQTPPAVPTTAPTYTLEHLAVAATSLVDAGRRQDIVNLLQGFGVAALTQLPKERYGEFATALRSMGAKL